MCFVWSFVQILRSFCNRSPPTNLNPSIRCGIDVPDGALLYDKLSLMWGEFEDKVDELTMTMLANQVEIQRDQWQLERTTCFVDHSQHSQGKVGRSLAGARPNLAADRQDEKAKQVVKMELDAQYLDYMTEGKKRTFLTRSGVSGRSQGVDGH